MGNATFIAQSCNLFYWTSLSVTGEPLMGTMRAKNNNQYDKDNGPCTEARLTTTQMQPPAGQTQCFFKSGFRYFYQIDKNKHIVPNSMIQVPKNGKPPYMCVGNHTYLEYKNFSPAPVNAISA